MYAHINTPHTPKWIPLGHFLSAYRDTRFNVEAGVLRGNALYLNDGLDKMLRTMEKLGLLKNSIVIVTADHSNSSTAFIRGYVNKDVKGYWKRSDSHEVAVDYPRAIYARKGWCSINNETMNIPFLMLAPKDSGIRPGRIGSWISSLDISPTLLDLTLKKKEPRFSGKSFARLLVDGGQREKEKVFTRFIPLTGRFMRGFILDGKYKYSLNLAGLYKYQEVNGRKLLAQQEYLYDLEKDPCESVNLALDHRAPELLAKMRRTYLDQHTDYDEKNFIYIAPSPKGTLHHYRISVRTPGTKLVYAKAYAKKARVMRENGRALSFEVPVEGKGVHLSFETVPAGSPVSITVMRDGKPVSRGDIYATPEELNIYQNPMDITPSDFNIVKTPGRTGLELRDIPPGGLFYSRVPLNYWLEMGLGDRDIRLGTGIKEVLRGWGYIQ